MGNGITEETIYSKVVPFEDVPEEAGDGLKEGFVCHSLLLHQSYQTVNNSSEGCFGEHYSLHLQRVGKQPALPWIVGHDEPTRRIGWPSLRLSAFAFGGHKEVEGMYDGLST